MLPLWLYSTIKCQFVEMSGDAVSEEASTIYDVDEVVESALGSDSWVWNPPMFKSMLWGEPEREAAGR